MEANEAQELQENAEHGASMRPVGFTMSVLAVLVAVTTVLGHRTHTEAVLTQNQATDQWNYYQAHKIRANETKLAAELLGAMTLADQHKAGELAKSYADDLVQWKQEMTDEKNKADALEARVKESEARADRFDLAEALLEIGLVITSVTLLTRSRIYWYAGAVFSVAGVASAASAYLVH